MDGGALVVVAAMAVPPYLIMGMLFSSEIKNPFVRAVSFFLWPIILPVMGVNGLVGAIVTGRSIDDGPWIEK